MPLILFGGHLALGRRQSSTTINHQSISPGSILTVRTPSLLGSAASLLVPSAQGAQPPRAPNDVRCRRCGACNSRPAKCVNDNSEAFDSRIARTKQTGMVAPAGDGAHRELRGERGGLLLPRCSWMVPLPGCSSGETIGSGVLSYSVFYFANICG